MAAARRALSGDKARGDKARGADGDAQRARDALWDRAAKWQAAADARKAARDRGQPGPAKPGPGKPGPGPGGREAFRPWFAESSDGELWLSAEEKTDPWFWPDER
jgi:hypothetical protein